MKIGVIGAGSLGLLFAGKLSTVMGADIHLITRTAEQAEAINRNGIIIHEQNGTEHHTIKSLSINEFAKENATWDWLLLMTKQTQLTDSLLKAIAGVGANAGVGAEPCEGKNSNTKLLCFQNGTGHIERIAQAGFSLERIYIAVTTEAARKDAENEVAHTGTGATSVGGAVPCKVGWTGGPSQVSWLLLPLMDLFQQADLSIQQNENIHQAVWNKLVINSIINPLTAIMNIKNGELLASPYTLRMMRSLFDEACAVLNTGAAGTVGVQEALWDTVLQVCKTTAQNNSSMLQDLRAGRETEIDWINGSLLRLASEAQLSVPTHETLYHMVKGLTQLRGPHGSK